jgi:hypothetical protein
VGRGEETQKLTGLWLIARNAGWFLPHGKICWISERHNILRRDDRGRLHCENGPALSYPDGWNIYAVHGVRVPARIIEQPGSLTIAEIEKESNTEIRRVMIERYGPERFLFDSGAAEIHRDAFGVLFKKELPNDEPIVMVRVVNSTPEPDGTLTRDEALRQFSPESPVCHDGMMLPLSQVPVSLRFKAYMHRVPPAVSRAKEAVAWMNYKAEDEYNPLYQT